MSDTTSINPLICSSCRANLVCPSCANAMADYLKTINTDAEVQRLREIVAIARELAAKCVRGQNACTACGSCFYLGSFAHNEGCPVLRLEAFR